MMCDKIKMDIETKDVNWGYCVLKWDKIQGDVAHLFIDIH